MVLGCLKLEFRVTFFEVLDFLKLKFHEKWNIAKYFSNSGKTLIILKNSGIWLFLPIYIYFKICPKAAFGKYSHRRT